MSGGTMCRCFEITKPLAERRWRVLDYRCNHSAFNGYRYTSSDYSAVACDRCQRVWRTKARYVDSLRARGAAPEEAPA